MRTPRGDDRIMAANARYEPAPQRDSFEERTPYTQAPPSYQASAEFPDAPRSEGDNVPDDFKVSFCESVLSTGEET